LIDKNHCGYLQKLPGVHSSNSFQFPQFLPYVSLDLANKSGFNRVLFLSSF
jgi:hypothetical protein